MSWILELDSGTHGLGSKDSSEQRPSGKLAIEEEGLTLVICQLYAKYGVYQMEYLLDWVWFTCPVHSSL